MFIGPLHNSGCPIVESVCFGKVFTEPLPSNGHVLQIIIYIRWRCRECTAFNSSSSVRLYSEVPRLWECFTCIVRCQDMLVKSNRRYDWTQGKFHLMCVNKMYAWVDSCTWSLPLQLKAEFGQEYKFRMATKLWVFLSSLIDSSIQYRCIITKKWWQTKWKILMRLKRRGQRALSSEIWTELWAVKLWRGD